MENKKPVKILLIDIQNHNYAGGVETYNRDLMKILHQAGYEVYEYSTCQNVQKKVCERFEFVHDLQPKRQFLLSESVESNYRGSFKQRMQEAFADFKTLSWQRKDLKKIASNYDLIIDSSTVQCALSDKDHPRIIWVQHLDLAYAKKIYYFPRLILKFLLRLHFPYNSYHRKVLFSEFSKNRYFSKKTKKNARLQIFLNHLCTPINQNDAIDIKAKYEKPISWLGRATDLAYKRVDLANEIAAHLNKRVVVYGPFWPDMIKKYPNLTFKGPYNRNELANIFDESSLTLITSQSEGFPFAAVETIANNTPLALRNSFTDAPFLTKFKNGCLYDKNANAEDVAKMINNLLANFSEYEQLVKNTIYCKKEFDSINFQKKWLEIIQTVLAQNGI
ncbi:glycosyltransferase [[Mycoplasma] testudinis]|uniref:glycosyltransferase n=1 Tax=[Mycoplasma] testudinis TaxID=33924 RepID=UPI0004893D62|nr:glycosyltransferase [[Mycoplasma] testudinis]